MPHKNRRNLFEEHIESDDFDVSRLGLTYGMSDLSSQVSELLAQLPRPFDYRIWDQYLDERQKLLCAQLTFEIIDHVIREQHLQDTIHLSDDDLVQMLTVPIAISILAESMSSREHDVRMFLDQPVPDEPVHLEPLTKPLAQEEQPAPAKSIWSSFMLRIGRILNRWFGS